LAEDHFTQEHGSFSETDCLCLPARTSIDPKEIQMNKQIKIALCLALSLNGAAFASVAAASTATTVIPVSAVVIDSCTVLATPLAFGNYNSLSGGMVDAVSLVTPICTIGTAYSVSLDAGQGSGATPAVRRLNGNDGATLNYSIYTDASRHTVWGDNSGGTAWKTGSGSGSPQSIMMYGRIPASQPTVAGVYSDIVTVTLTY
jgi:spore coat protein U-like protein